MNKEKARGCQNDTTGFLLLTKSGYAKFITAFFWRSALSANCAALPQEWVI